MHRIQDACSLSIFPKGQNWPDKNWLVSGDAIEPPDHIRQQRVVQGAIGAHQPVLAVAIAGGTDGADTSRVLGLHAGGAFIQRAGQERAAPGPLVAYGGRTS
jgi:hypothetical protein